MLASGMLSIGFLLDSAFVLSSALLHANHLTWFLGCAEASFFFFGRNRSEFMDDC